jgi:uncharacterized protein (TIGR00297 family)
MSTDLFPLALSVVVVIVLGALSLKVGIIGITGFIAAELVGGLILIVGGVEWFAVLLVFYVAAGLFTKYKYEFKKKIGAAEEKGGARAWQNVVANGLIASLLVVGRGFMASSAFSAGFLGAISTSAADTLATEIGLLNSRQPRLITDLSKSVEPGTSGGVTPLGMAASLLGGILMGFAAWAVGFSGFTLQKTLVVAVLAGVLGSAFDSLLGASIQARYRCPTCSKTTEKRFHCEQACILTNGHEIFDNNVVNLISTAFGASVATLISLVI